MAARRLRRRSPRRPAPDRAGSDPQTLLRAAGFTGAADRLAADRASGLASDVDLHRLAGRLHDVADDADALASASAQIHEHGARALAHQSGQRDLSPRVAEHDLERGQVRVGVATGEPRNPAGYRRKPFALDTDVLRTSLLVIGPPGSGKTRSFAVPLLEHLCLQSLAHRASVLAIDPKGSDFEGEGRFDVEIDPVRPDNAWGFDLYGGAETTEEAADRLASALLPPDVSADKLYFHDAARNALYQALAAFHAAREGRYPAVRELLALLRGDPPALRSVRDRLQGRGLLEQHEAALADRTRQRRQRDDPAASLLERLGLLNRPDLVRLFDETRPRFAMRDLNTPIRVRLVLPEAQYPHAAVILARLAVSQFVQVTSAPSTNRAIFKGLLLDEAGRYVDDYVARGVQRVRANNAGLVLLTQSLADFPDDLVGTIFGSVGCKAVFAGVNPGDARYLADYWGSRWVSDVTLTHRRSTADSRSWGAQPDQDRQGEARAEDRGMSLRRVERHLWSPAEIINDVPPGHALVSLARSDGVRTPPVLVNLRA